MATSSPQSVEDYADRIVYRFTACRFEQTPTTWVNIGNPGLTALVNTQTNLSWVVPASGLPARFFKIDWVFNTFAVFDAGADGLRNIHCGFSKIVSTSPALNYDGKTLQTEFYNRKSENIYASAQLRAINIKDISIEPIFHTTDIAGAGAALASVIDFNVGASTFYIVALMQPTVTFFKK